MGELVLRHDERVINSGCSHPRRAGGVDVGRAASKKEQIGLDIGDNSILNFVFDVKAVAERLLRVMRKIYLNTSLVLVLLLLCAALSEDYLLLLKVILILKPIKIS